MLAFNQLQYPRKCRKGYVVSVLEKCSWYFVNVHVNFSDIHHLVFNSTTILSVYVYLCRSIEYLGHIQLFLCTLWVADCTVCSTCLEVKDLSLPVCSSRTCTTNTQSVRTCSVRPERTLKTCETRPCPTARCSATLHWPLCSPWTHWQPRSRAPFGKAWTPQLPLNISESVFWSVDGCAENSLSRTDSQTEFRIQKHECNKLSTRIFFPKRVINGSLVLIVNTQVVPFFCVCACVLLFFIKWSSDLSL